MPVSHRRTAGESPRWTRITLAQAPNRPPANQSTHRSREFPTTNAADPGLTVVRDKDVRRAGVSRSINSSESRTDVKRSQNKNFVAINTWGVSAVCLDSLSRERLRSGNLARFGL